MTPDFSEIHGLDDTLAAVARAVAAREPFLLIGPPGAGKTMIARRVPSILPERTEIEIQQAIMIWHAAGLDPARVVAAPPFRAPHHTALVEAITGTLRPQTTCLGHPRDVAWRRKHGRSVLPGEVSLAHGGALFLDDLPEFSVPVIRAIGTALRAGCTVLHHRELGHVEVHAAPLLVAAAALCPCGAVGSTRACNCGVGTRRRWDVRLDEFCRQLGITTRIELPGGAR